VGGVELWRAPDHRARPSWARAELLRAGHPAGVHELVELPNVEQHTPGSRQELDGLQCALLDQPTDHPAADAKVGRGRLDRQQPGGQPTG